MMLLQPSHTMLGAKNKDSNAPWFQTSQQIADSASSKVLVAIMLRDQQYFQRLDHPIQAALGALEITSRFTMLSRLPNTAVVRGKNSQLTRF